MALVAGPLKKTVIFVAASLSIIFLQSRMQCNAPAEIADPAGFYPEPDKTFEKKPGSGPGPPTKKP